MDTCSKWWISHKYPLVSVKGRTVLFVSGFVKVSTGSQTVQLPCSSTLAWSPSSLVTGWWANTRLGGGVSVTKGQSGQKKVWHCLFNLFWRKPRTYEYTLTYKQHIGRLCLFVCEPVYLRAFAVQSVVMVLCLSVNVLLFPFTVLSLWADQQAYSSSLLRPRGSLC